MGEWLPRSARLTKTADYSAVFANRCVARSEYLAVFVKRGPVIGRLGMAVSRKTAPRAVDRNYMKRIIRDIFRRNSSSFAGADVVVSPRRIFPRGQARAIEADLIALLGPLGRKCLASCKA